MGGTEKYAREAGGLASLPPGGGAWGLATASARASKRQRLFRKRLAVFEFESKSLDDRPSSMAMSGRFESSPSKLESRAYVSQSACAPRYPNSTGWPIGRVRPSNASPSPIGRSSREPRADRAEIRSSREPAEPILIINSNKIQKSEFTPVGLAARIGDTGQFTNSWPKMNTAPPEYRYR